MKRKASARSEAMQTARAQHSSQDAVLQTHLQRLQQLGLLTWDVLCKGTSRYAPSADDPPLAADELPYEDVFNAGLPLQSDDTVLLSNGRCYSRSGMRQWINEFRQRTVRPRFPDTRSDLQLADLLLLDVDDAQQLIGQPSLARMQAAADAGDINAQRQLRHEQTSVVLAQRITSPLSIEPLQANETHSWFHRLREEPGTVDNLLRNKPVGAFVVIWPPNSQTRGSLAYINEQRNINRAALTFSGETGYRSPDVTHLMQRYGQVGQLPRFLSLTQLLLERPLLRWPRDALPVPGYRGSLSASDAVDLLWPQPLGTYIVRRSSRDPYRLVVSFRDRDQVTHLSVRVHSGQHDVFGFAAPDDPEGYLTLQQYIDALALPDDNAVLPSTPL